MQKKLIYMYTKNYYRYMYSINHNILPREEGANKFFINSCNTYKFEVIFIELKNKIFYGYIF